ncbi:MAG TPA: thioesterase family protein, partial [Polyangiales bacterium]
MAMIEVLRSGVNTWECDQMGHMNVRHYFARANQGLVTLALELGLPPSLLRRQGQALRARDQHVRFVRELRPGVSYTLSAGVLHESAERLQVYEELRSLHDGEVAASVLSEIELVEGNTGTALPLPAVVRERAASLRVQPPTQYAPRGVERTPPRTAPRRSEALELGLV